MIVACRLGFLFDWIELPHRKYNVLLVASVFRKEAREEYRRFVSLLVHFGVTSVNLAVSSLSPAWSAT